MSVGFNSKEIGSDLSESSFSVVLVVAARSWWTRGGRCEVLEMKDSE